MKLLRRFTTTLAAIAASGLSGAWAQVNEPGKSWHYMEHPVLPAPPPATEAQLERGEKLLNTLLKIASSVSLTNSAAVLKELGVAELYTKKHSNHLWITPKSPSRDDMRPDGFESIEMVQLNDPYKPGGRSRLSISLLPNVTCITPQMMERHLPKIPRTTMVRPETHPIPKPPEFQPIDVLFFSPLDTPEGKIGSISTEFSYQQCAESIGLAYPSLKQRDGVSATGR